MLSGPPRSRNAGAAFLAYGLLTAWLLAPVLFRGATLFFRDITYIYYPNYVFLESALRQGVWPLWNPSADAGAPFVAPVAAWYLPDVALAWLAGARGVLAIGPPLHVWLAMAGAFGLARAAGRERRRGVHGRARCRSVGRLAWGSKPKGCWLERESGKPSNQIKAGCSLRYKSKSPIEVATFLPFDQACRQKGGIGNCGLPPISHQITLWKLSPG